VQQTLQSGVNWSVGCMMPLHDGAVAVAGSQPAVTGMLCCTSRVIPYVLWQLLADSSSAAVVVYRCRDFGACMHSLSIKFSGTPRGHPIEGP
jgi:hypothetical protein